jgi:ubiquinone/menaquinone biosynthesis C-methylase UbiE
MSPVLRNSAKSKLVESMRQDWDTRARKDAFFYIASWRKDWNESSFLQSGEDDYKHFVADVLQRHQFSPEGKSMLELGCGAGRMTRSFAQRFDRVLACDVSEEMLERARTLHREISNISWMHGNGADLTGIPSGSVDFVFSYLVLQHLPSEVLFHAYVREILRVLANGGICIFQFNGTTTQNMNWKGRMAWAFLNSLWALRLGNVSKSIATLLGFDPEMTGRTWHGVAVRPQGVVETVEKNGGFVLEKSGRDTPMAWCCAQKTSQDDTRRG